ncbi:unnamed protein product [Gordionus sp. m RMFG-2023]
MQDNHGKISILYDNKHSIPKSGNKFVPNSKMSLSITNDQNLNLDLSDKQLKDLEILLNLMEPPLEFIKSNAKSSEDMDKEELGIHHPRNLDSEYQKGVLDLTYDEDIQNKFLTPMLDAHIRQRNKSLSGTHIKDWHSSNYLLIIFPILVLVALAILLLYCFCCKRKSKGKTKHNIYCTCETCQNEKAKLIKDNDDIDENKSRQFASISKNALCKYCGNDVTPSSNVKHSLPTSALSEIESSFKFHGREDSANPFANRDKNVFFNQRFK